MQPCTGFPAAKPWWNSPMPRKVGRDRAGMWWLHSGEAGGLALFIATCSLQMPFQTTFQSSHKAGGTTISLLPVETTFPCLCQRGTGCCLLNSWFPTQAQKARSQTLQIILISVISSRIKPYTPNGQDQTYLTLLEYPFRQYLCTYFQESIQPGPSQHCLEAFLAH